MDESLGDKIVAFVDDREQRGIETVSAHVKDWFVLSDEDAYEELAELIDTGRICMYSDERLGCLVFKMPLRKGDWP